MIPVTGSGWIPRKRSSFRRFPAGKDTGRWKQYSGRKVIVPGNEEVRKVPCTGLSQEMTRIWARNKLEFNISHRNWTETLRIAIGYQMENIRFRRLLVK